MIFACRPVASAATESAMAAAALPSALISDPASLPPLTRSSPPLSVKEAPILESSRITIRILAPSDLPSEPIFLIDVSPAARDASTSACGSSLPSSGAEREAEERLPADERKFPFLECASAPNEVSSFSNAGSGGMPSTSILPATAPASKRKEDRYELGGTSISPGGAYSWPPCTYRKSLPSLLKDMPHFFITPMVCPTYSQPGICPSIPISVSSMRKGAQRSRPERNCVPSW